MAKRMTATDGIEKGEFQTSGADGDLEQEESTQRGDDGSAIMGKPKMMANAPPHHFAHKRPMTG